MAVDAHAVAQHTLKRVTAARSEVWYPTTSVGDVTLALPLPLPLEGPLERREPCADVSRPPFPCVQRRSSLPPRAAAAVKHELSSSPAAVLSASSSEPTVNRALRAARALPARAVRETARFVSSLGAVACRAFPPRTFAGGRNGAKHCPRGSLLLRLG